MSTSPNLDLPLVAAGQAQKHVTVNESLLAVDGLMHIAVDGSASNAPPVEPSQGSRWLIGDEPSGAWTDQAGKLAVFLDGGWRFHTPRAGWLALASDTGGLVVFDGTTWVEPTGPSSLESLSKVGVGMVAEPSRPLSVAGAGSLFTHVGDDHRLTLNKAAPADTTSLVFQSNWSGRAEIGLTGDDALHLKVSSNGATWKEAIRVDPTSGGVSMRFFDSQQLMVGYNAVGTVTPPSSGGIVFISVVDAVFPQNPTAGILAYDCGSSPLLSTMVIGASIENKGTATLTGTAATDGKIGVAVDSAGHIFIENRFLGGMSRQVCLTFINSWRPI